MLEISLALFAVLVVLWLRWRWQNTTVFKKLGIPGPKPSLLFGNLVELYSKGFVECQKQWIEKYGRVLGYYYGMRPIILIADPEKIKYVLIKDFNKFPNRRPNQPLRNPKSEDTLSKHIINLNGPRWKEMRSILTPTFSTSKMKQMSPTIGSTVDLFITKIKESAEAGEEFNIHDLFQKLTMDVICRTAFGINIDVQNKDLPALRLAQLMFDFKFASALNFIGLCFPGLRFIAGFFGQLRLFLRNKGMNPVKQLLRGCGKIIKLRRSDPKLRSNDLLQLMLDARISYSDLSAISNDRLIAGSEEAETDKEIKTDSENKDAQMRHLTDEEVQANLFLVFLAGYETTSTTLAFTAQLLVHHPEIQDKIFEEVDEVLQKGGKLDYSSVNQMSYLDMVLNESLRLHPPVRLSVNRVAVQNVKYDDLLIPKGMQVQIPVHGMHHDPEFWPNPENFDPERFSVKPNTHGITFLPFGGGPRNCMGMRFAQMEAKMALAHLIHKFKLIPGDHTEKKVTVIEKIATSPPTYGVPLKALIRENETSV